MNNFILKLFYNKYILLEGTIYNKKYLADYCSLDSDDINYILYTLYLKIGFCKLLSLLDGHFTLIITDNKSINIGKDRLNINKIFINYASYSISFIEIPTFFKLNSGAFILKKNEVNHKMYDYIEPTYNTVTFNENYLIKILKQSIIKIYDNSLNNKLAFILKDTIGSELIHDVIINDCNLSNNIIICDNYIDETYTYITDYFFEELVYVKKYNDLNNISFESEFDISTPFLDRYIIDLFITYNNVN